MRILGLGARVGRRAAARPPRRRRAPAIPWVVYGLGWLTFGVGYAASHWLRPGASVDQVLRASLIVVVPAAVLGTGVMRVCRAMAWPPAGRAVFFASHAALALAFPAVWVLSIAGPTSLYRSVVAGQLTFAGPPAAVLHWHVVSGVLIYATLAAVTYAMAGFVRAERWKRRAEWEALQAQLNPHFLFNTLHSLMALIESDPAAARQAIERMAGLLRYSLSIRRQPSDVVALGDEWAFTRDYLALERLRLGDRLRVDTAAHGGALATQVPAFLLQPLVENAIRHGISPRAAGGTIRIDARVRDGRLVLRVADDGRGAAAAAWADTPGVGLRSVRERIDGYYGDDASFEIRTAPGEGFEARIEVPVTPGRRAPS